MRYKILSAIILPSGERVGDGTADLQPDAAHTKRFLRLGCIELAQEPKPAPKTKAPKTKARVYK